MQTRNLAREVRGELERQVENSRYKNPFVELADRIARPTYFPVTSLQATKETVRIALVSLPQLPLDNASDVQITDHSILTESVGDGIDHKACLRRLVRFSSEFTAKLEGWYREALSFAVEEKGADIVCVNELGFPTSNRQQPLKRVINWTRRLAQVNNCFIVAGSCHDRRTLFNSGHIFFPGCPSHGEIFHKQVSAISVEERISLPPERRAICTKVFGLDVATLICLDLADFSSVSAVVRAADKIDLLLVPCYSEWIEALERIARQASGAMSGIVALANYRRVGQLGYVFTKFGNSIVAAETVDVNADRAEGCVSLFDLNVPRFRSEKTERQLSLSADERLEWLFGPQTCQVRKR